MSKSSITLLSNNEKFHIHLYHAFLKMSLLYKKDDFSELIFVHHYVKWKLIWKHNIYCPFKQLQPLLIGVYSNNETKNIFNLEQNTYSMALRSTAFGSWKAHTAQNVLQQEWWNTVRQARTYWGIPSELWEIGVQYGPTVACWRSVLKTIGSWLYWLGSAHFAGTS